jgi:hypothetical protein
VPFGVGVAWLCRGIATAWITSFAEDFPACCPYRRAIGKTLEKNIVRGFFFKKATLVADIRLKSGN